MIQEHFDMSTADKLVLIAQVFAKIAYNFWPALIAGVFVVVQVIRSEKRSRRSRSRE